MNEVRELSDLNHLKLIVKDKHVAKEPEPKIAIFPTKFNFRRYETARRISEQEDINSRPNRGVDDLPGLLERYFKKSSGTRGVKVNFLIYFDRITFQYKTY
jgi:hypothetical protein